MNTKRSHLTVRQAYARCSDIMDEAGEHGSVEVVLRGTRARTQGRVYRRYAFRGPIGEVIRWGPDEVVLRYECTVLLADLVRFLRVGEEVLTAIRAVRGVEKSDHSAVILR